MCVCVREREGERERENTRNLYMALRIGDVYLTIRWWIYYQQARPRRVPERQKQLSYSVSPTFCSHIVEKEGEEEKEKEGKNRRGREIPSSHVQLHNATRESVCVAARYTVARGDSFLHE